MITYKTARQIVNNLKKLKSLKHWDIKSNVGVLKLYYPKAHRRFAQKYREAIEQYLKVEMVMDPECEVQLFRK